MRLNRRCLYHAKHTMHYNMTIANRHDQSMYTYHCQISIAHHPSLTKAGYYIAAFCSSRYNSPMSMLPHCCSSPNCTAPSKPHHHNSIRPNRRQRLLLTARSCNAMTAPGPGLVPAYSSGRRAVSSSCFPCFRCACSPPATTYHSLCVYLYCTTAATS